MHVIKIQNEYVSTLPYMKKKKKKMMKQKKTRKKNMTYT